MKVFKQKIIRKIYRLKEKEIWRMKNNYEVDTILKLRDIITFINPDSLVG